MARPATESCEHNRCDFENSKRDGRVQDTTDKYGTVCHGMSKSLVVIVLTGIKKVKVSYIVKNFTICINSCHFTDRQCIFIHCTEKRFRLQRKKVGKNLTQSYRITFLNYHQKLKVKRKHKDTTKNVDYITISDQLRTVSWRNPCHPNGIINPFSGSHPSQ